MAEYLRFVVKEQKLSIKGGAVIYSDTISYIGATFLFNSDWDGLDKVLHLQKDGDDTVYDLAIEDDKIDPSTSGMNLSSGIWQFWVHGTLLSGSTEVKRLTTNKTPLEVKQSGVLDGDPLPTVRETVAEQVLAKAAYAERNAIAAGEASIDSTSGTPTVGVSFESLTTGKKIKFAFTGLKGAKGDKGDPGIAGDFNALTNRPSYNGNAITGTTNIPEVKTSTWDSKQDAISDLTTIRTNASEAAAVKHSHDNKSVLDTITSALVTAWTTASDWVTTNGANMLTHVADTVAHVTASERTAWNAKQDAISDLATIRSNASEGAAKVSCTDATVGGFGYTKNTGTYSKPSGGIPKTDLASAVQTSLGKADTALQEHQSLSAYRTSANQDTIDNALDARIDTLENLGLSVVNGAINITYEVTE